MNSIFNDFEEIFNLLKKELDAYKTDHYDLRHQVHKLIDENKKLSIELKENVNARIVEPSVESVIRGLEEQLYEAINDKRALLEKWPQADANIKHTEAQTRLPEIENRIVEIKDHYTKGLGVLQVELAETKQLLTTAKEQLNTKNIDYQELQNSLNKSKEEIKLKENLISELRSENSTLMQKIINLETVEFNSQQNLDNIQKELTKLKDKNNKLSQINKELEKSNSELNLHKFEHQKKSKDSVIALEQALLCQKELEYKEKQMLKSMENLKDMISQEVEHHTSKLKNENKDVKIQLEIQIDDLKKEIKELQIENSEKQSLFERAVREKKALDSKLDALLNINSIDCAVPNHVYEDTCRRLTLSERVRDQALLQVQSLESSLKALQSTTAREIEFFKLESKSLKEQLQKHKLNMNETLNERAQLTDEMSALKTRITVKEKELKSLNVKYRYQFEKLQQAMLQERENCRNQLKANEQYCNQKALEIHQLLEAQHKVNKKWKDTVQELTEKSELKVREMNHEIAMLQNRNGELSRNLKKQQTVSPLSLV